MVAVVNVTKLRNSAGGSVSGAIADMAANSAMAALLASYRSAAGGQSSQQASDSENLSYTYSTGANIAAGSSNVALSGFFFGNTVAGAASSGNASGGVGAIAITAVFYEVSGISTTTPFVSGESIASTGNSTAPNTGQVINSVANSILIGAMSNLDPSNPIQYTINQTGTIGTYTENTSSGRELNGATFATLGTVTQVVASTGSSQRHVWQSSAQGWGALMFALAGAAGGGGTARPTPTLSLMGAGR